MTLNFCQIQQITTELVALVCLNNQCLHLFPVSTDLILFKLADKKEMHNILDVFEVWPAWTAENRISCPLAFKKYSDWVIMRENVSTIFLGCLLENWGARWPGG